ncbi:MAG: ribosomal RNA small subunit methyltransferase A [Acidobacteria bacterium]|nr:MAG: ribosomal RNA small subunit methyltransferase A [Acidobacteriota bacterium]
MSRQKLGQHFLVKTSILDRIAKAACPELPAGSEKQKEPLVVEIGPGKGALTARLLDRAERVIAIEIDSAMLEHLAGKFSGNSRLTLVHADALDLNLGQWGRAVITGNLPYYAATPIIEKTLQLGNQLMYAMFLIQKEVAERLTAAPGSREYGYLTVRTRLSADADRLFDVHPSAFRPPPKVDSTLIRLRPHDRARELGIDDAAAFLEFAGLCFHQKRKTLRNNLVGAYGKESVDGLPEASRRAEQLTLEQFAELYRKLCA